MADAGANRVISGESVSAMKLGPAVLHLSKLASSFEGLDRTRVVRLEQIGEGCEHVDDATAVLPSAGGCESCLRMGESWVHLRICLTCGHVGCCDSSPHKHASKHYAETGHPMMVSAEPGEAWAWCFVDQLEMRTREPVESRDADADAGPSRIGSRAWISKE